MKYLTRINITLSNYLFGDNLLDLRSVGIFQTEYMFNLSNLEDKNDSCRTKQHQRSQCADYGAFKLSLTDKQD